MSLAISKATFPKVAQQNRGLRPAAPFLHQTSQKRNPSQEHEGLLPAGLYFATFFRYSHSFTLVCRGAIPIGSSLVVGFVHLAAESLRVSSRKRLGQALGQNRKLFRSHKLAVSFLSQGQKRVGFEALKRPRWTIKRLIFLFGVCLAK